LQKEDPSREHAAQVNETFISVRKDAGRKTAGNADEAAPGSDAFIALVSPNGNLVHDRLGICTLNIRSPGRIFPVRSGCKVVGLPLIKVFNCAGFTVRSCHFFHPGAFKIGLIPEILRFDIINFISMDHF